MKNEERITEEQRQKEESEMEEKRKFYFAREEIIKGYAHWDLGEFGDFIGEYVVPEEKKVYGYWHPEMRYWLSRRAYITYTLSASDEEETRHMVKYYHKGFSYATTEKLLQRWCWVTWHLEFEDDSEYVCYEHKSEKRLPYYNPKTRSKNTSNKRRIFFTDEEKNNKLMHWNLGEYGNFYGVYIVPEERKIYGLHVPRENSKFVHWASIHYIPYKCDEKLEKQFIENPNATVSDFIKGLRWFLWYVLIEDEQERERWEDGKENSENLTLV